MTDDEEFAEIMKDNHFGCAKHRESLRRCDNGVMALGIIIPCVDCSRRMVLTLKRTADHFASIYKALGSK